MAPGMWPRRCAASCGRWAGAASSPRNSSGERTSTRLRSACPDPVDHLLPVGTQLLARRRWQRDGARRVARRIGRERQAVGLDLGAAAVEEPDVVEPLVARLPVGPGREPVVVVAVQHDRGVVVHAGGTQQVLELLAAHEVAAHGVGELRLPVHAGGAGQMTGVVGVGVDVDLQEPDGRVVEMVPGPVGGDERSGTRGGGCFCNGHGWGFADGRRARGLLPRGRRWNLGRNSDRFSRSIASGFAEGNPQRQDRCVRATAPVGLSTRW